MNLSTISLALVGKANKAPKPSLLLYTVVSFWVVPAVMRSCVVASAIEGFKASG